MKVLLGHHLSNFGGVVNGTVVERGVIEIVQSHHACPKLDENLFNKKI